MNELAKYIKEWRERKGFSTPSDIVGEEQASAMLAKLMLVVTEVAEAAEAVRHNDRHNFEEEMADTIIRILDIVGTCDIDIDSVVAHKMAVNERRPEKHGKVC